MWTAYRSTRVEHTHSEGAADFIIFFNPTFVVVISTRLWAGEQQTTDGRLFISYLTFFLILFINLKCSPLKFILNYWNRQDICFTCTVYIHCKRYGCIYAWSTVHVLFFLTALTTWTRYWYIYILTLKITFGNICWLTLMTYIGNKQSDLHLTVRNMGVLNSLMPNSTLYMYAHTWNTRVTILDILCCDWRI